MEEHAWGGVAQLLLAKGHCAWDVAFCKGPGDGAPG